MPKIWGLTERKKWEATIAELDKGGTVTLQQLQVTSLTQPYAVAKLFIEKRVITQAEFRLSVTPSAPNPFSMRTSRQVNDLTPM